MMLYATATASGRPTLRQRLAQCGLELHPQKTRIVYCKDADRRGDYPETSFDFLGYTFLPRLSMNRWGKTFVNFSPAVSNSAQKGMIGKLRKLWIRRRVEMSLEDIANWLNYYAQYHNQR